MFVTKRTYSRHINEVGLLGMYWKREYHQLLDQWNALMHRINDAGGESIFQRQRQPQPQQLTDDDLRKLLQLCHPDHHDGKPMAVEMTQKLLSLRR